MRFLSALILLACAALAAAKAPRDVHSYAQPDQVVIRDIGLDLRVDFALKQLRGRADLALHWLDPQARELVLDTRDLTLGKVLGKRREGGWVRLDYTLSERDPILGQKLVIQLPRQYDTVRIHYATSPQASGLQWLEPGMTAGGKQPFMFSQSQAIHARSWVPLQDTPAVRYTYSARLRTDPALMALMSADNPPDEPRDGDYVFRMRQPIPSYLMSIAAGDLVFKALSPRSGIWAEPATLEAAHAEFIDTEKMIQVAESLYGPYRWERYDLLILPPSFPFGGMENPRLSYITPTVIVGDKSLVALVAHELAHSWSGNLVTNASWNDLWLNEGFTSYVENRLVEALYGEDMAAMERAISQADLLRELKTLRRPLQVLAPPPTPGTDPDDSIGAIAYDKGAWFLFFIESRVGRGNFDAFLRGYFDHFSFKSIQTEQFVQYLNAHLLARFPDAITPKELDAWLYRPGLPASAVPTVSARFEAVDAQRKRWLSGEIGGSQIEAGAWITQEWIRFLEGMPAKLPHDRLTELDQAFHFTASANGEILMRWFPLAERSGYFEARPAMAAFLQRVGRRKLIMPVYEALAASREGREFARKVFEQARPGYHPITTGSVEALLGGGRK